MPRRRIGAINAVVPKHIDVSIRFVRKPLTVPIHVDTAKRCRFHRVLTKLPNTVQGFIR